MSIFSASQCVSYRHSKIIVHTSELQAAELEGDQAVSDLDEVHQGVEVVGGQDEAVAGAAVPPAAQQEVPTQRVLQGACQVLVEDGVQVVVVTA